MGGTSPPMVASRGTSSINRSHWLSFQNGQLTTDKHTQEEECRPVVDDGRGWCLTGWLSGHGARKFSKQSSAAPETRGGDSLSKQLNRLLICLCSCRSLYAGLSVSPAVCRNNRIRAQPRRYWQIFKYFRQISKTRLSPRRTEINTPIRSHLAVSSWAQLQVPSHGEPRRDRLLGWSSGGLGGREVDAWIEGNY